MFEYKICRRSSIPLTCAVLQHSRSALRPKRLLPPASLRNPHTAIRNMLSVVSPGLRRDKAAPACLSAVDCLILQGDGILGRLDVGDNVGIGHCLAHSRFHFLGKLVPLPHRPAPRNQQVHHHEVARRRLA